MSYDPFQRSPITDEEAQLLQALAACKFHPGAADRRFILHMAAATKRTNNLGLTEGQRAYLWRLGFRYRHQLPPEINAMVAAHGSRSPQ
jgi:hypothetical protein